MPALLTFDQFIAALPAARQAPMRQLWAVLCAAVPAEYIPHIGPKMLELRVGKQVCIALASQKNYLSLHLVPMYVLPHLQARMAAAAPALKMGKGCINFNQVAELPLPTLVDIISSTPVAEYVTPKPAGRK